MFSDSLGLISAILSFNKYFFGLNICINIFCDKFFFDFFFVVNYFIYL